VMDCDQCEAVMVNGVYCHEHGCPVLWEIWDEANKEK
jgi:hypothetical protein